MAVAVDAAAATGDLKAVQTGVRTSGQSAMNARKVVRKTVRKVVTTAVSVQMAARKIARIARWVMFASHKHVKPVVRPARTTATQPVARFVSTVRQTVVQTVSNARRRVNPVNRASPGQKQAAANVVAGNAASRVSLAAASVMQPSRIRLWPTRQPWRLP